MTKLTEDSGIQSILNFVNNKDTTKPKLESTIADSIGTPKFKLELLEQQFIALQMKFISLQSLKNQIFSQFKEIGLLSNYQEDTSLNYTHSFVPSLDDLTKVVNQKLLSKLDYLIHLNIQYEKKILTNHSTKLFETLEKHLSDQNKLLDKFEKCTSLINTSATATTSTTTNNSKKSTTIITSSVSSTKACTKSIEDLHFMMLEEMFKYTMLENFKNMNTNQHQISPVSNQNYKFPGHDKLDSLVSVDQVNNLKKDQLLAYFKFYRLNEKDLTLAQMKDYLLQFLGIGLLA